MFGMNLQKKRIAVVIGTKPEALKMAPVVCALRKHSDEIEVTIITPGQDRDMLDPVLALFKIIPDVNMDIGLHNQPLTDLTAQVLLESRKVLTKVKPDLLLVQGDTTPVFAAALCAFYLKISVGYVETGLRCHDFCPPYTEEFINRRLTSIVTDLYFAPTKLARDNLVRECVAPEKIVVTGNTVVDALDALLQHSFSLSGSPLENIPFEGSRVLMITSHWCESFGEGLANTCKAVKELVKRFTDLVVVYPLSLSPNIRSKIVSLLADVPRVFLLEPLDYLNFVHLMKRSYLILTDASGIQVEAPSIHKPLLVIGGFTERTEAFSPGLSKIIKNRCESIIFEVSRLLADEMAYNEMSKGINPYGDGQASERIADAVINWARGETELLSPDKQFMPDPIYRKFSLSSGKIS